MTDIKERYRPILHSFSRHQLVICWKIHLLPRGEQIVPGEWIFAVAELGRDPAAIDALGTAVDLMTTKPSFAEVMAVAEATKDLNRVLKDYRCQNGPTRRYGLRRGPRAMG
jgi:hypothetical protein